jgi:hypothetical protein
LGIHHGKKTSEPLPAQRPSSAYSAFGVSSYRQRKEQRQVEDVKGKWTMTENEHHANGGRGFAFTVGKS